MGRSGVAIAALVALAVAAGGLVAWGALLGPDDPHFDDRGTALAAGGGLLVVSLALLGVTTVLRARTARREAARRLRAEAVFRLTGARVAPEVYAINHELFERFQVRFAPDDPPVEASALTAGELARRVWQKVRADAAAGRRPLGAAHFGLVRKAVASLRGAGVDGVHSSDPLADVLPRRHRRAAWRRLQRLFNTPLPRLTFVAAAMWGYVAVAAGLSLAVVLPAAEWVRRMDPGWAVAGVELRPILPWLAGGTAAAFAVTVLALLVRVGGHRLWRVPDECRTVGRLTAVLFPYGRRPAGAEPEGGWTAATVWAEVRSAIAHVCGPGEAAVTETTMLGR